MARPSRQPQALNVEWEPVQRQGLADDLCINPDFRTGEQFRRYGSGRMGLEQR